MEPKFQYEPQLVATNCFAMLPPMNEWIGIQTDRKQRFCSGRFFGIMHSAYCKRSFGDSHMLGCVHSGRNACIWTLLVLNEKIALSFRLNKNLILVEVEMSDPGTCQLHLNKVWRFFDDSVTFVFRQYVLAQVHSVHTVDDSQRLFNQSCSFLIMMQPVLFVQLDIFSYLYSGVWTNLPRSHLINFGTVHLFFARMKMVSSTLPKVSDPVSVVVKPILLIRQK